MQIDATYSFAAPPQEVWTLLMDPQAIKACLPGCRELRAAGENRYEADMAVGVGAVNGTFNAVVTLSDLQPVSAYRLDVEAAGRPGFARGFARVVLREAAAGTEVSVLASAEVGGLIARMGQRLIDGVAKMTMDRFFGCLASRAGQSSQS
jgi:carbon monoxide dehydrogenase subunit G